VILRRFAWGDGSRPARPRSANCDRRNPAVFSISQFLPVNSFATRKTFAWRTLKGAPMEKEEG